MPPFGSPGCPGYYCVAFRNGGPEAGDTTRMSVMTEVDDLEAVLAAARSGAGGWEAVDSAKDRKSVV